MSPHDGPQIDERFAWCGGPSEIEELTNDARHLVGFGLDGNSAGGYLLGVEPAGAYQACPPGDNVQGRAKLMGDACRQAADRPQPIGMAKLLEGGNPGGGLAP